MLIDFNKMEAKVIPNFKGGEKEFSVKMFEDSSNKIMRAKLIPGASIGLHTHIEDCEIVYILEGEGTMVYENNIELLPKGSCHYCPKGKGHSLINKGNTDLEFIAIVSKN